jgi:hypothetical protein
VVSTTDPPSLTRHEERLERFIRVGEAIQSELDAYITGILPDLHTLVIPESPRVSRPDAPHRSGPQGPHWHETLHHANADDHRRECPERLQIAPRGTTET